MEAVAQHRVHVLNAMERATAQYAMVLVGWIFLIQAIENPAQFVMGKESVPVVMVQDADDNSHNRKFCNVMQNLRFLCYLLIK